MNDFPEHQIRAAFDDTSIRIYQAYSDAIADAALRHGKFVSPPFKMQRMTWIKPSFLWMMYRAGWGLKDADQHRILAIDISRVGFEWALDHSCPSRQGSLESDEEWRKRKASSPVRIQWDPERDLNLQALPYRTIQIGIGGDAVNRYVHEWTVRITDLTTLAHKVRSHVADGDLANASKLLPLERPYSYKF